MTEAQLKQYKFELVSETDTLTDHELLLEVLKEIKEIKSDVKSINNRIDNLVLKNNLVE